MEYYNTYPPNQGYGAVYTDTAPSSNPNDRGAGFIMNSPISREIGEQFYRNRDAIFKQYGYNDPFENQQQTQEEDKEKEYYNQFASYDPSPQYGQQSIMNPPQIQYNPYQQQYQYNYYNNGYYDPNGFYHNYYDPYEARKRYEEQMQAREREYQSKLKVWDVVVKANMKFHGYEVDGNIFQDEWEIPQEYHPTISIMTESGEHKKTINRFGDQPHKVMYENSFKHSQRMQYQYNQRNDLLRLLNLRDQQAEFKRKQEEEYIRQRKNYVYHGNDETLYEFLHGSGRERHIQFMYTDKLKQQKKNVGALYKKDQFDSVSEIYKINEAARMGVLAASKDNPIQISPGLIVNGLDDISISLPEHLKSTFQERRDTFMTAILSRNPNMHVPEHNLPPNQRAGGVGGGGNQ